MPNLRRMVIAAALGAALGTSFAAPALADDFRNTRSIIGDLIPITGDEDRAVNLDVRFHVNSARLTKDAMRQIEALGEAMRSPQLARSTFQINGHTDASGPAAFNKTLSEKRAIAVATYLVQHFAIDPARLTPVGWGEERLKNAFKPKSGENRRVEVVNTSPPQKSIPVAPQPQGIPVTPPKAAPQTMPTVPAPTVIPPSNAAPQVMPTVPAPTVPAPTVIPPSAPPPQSDGLQVIN